MFDAAVAQVRYGGTGLVLLTSTYCVMLAIAGTVATPMQVVRMKVFAASTWALYKSIDLEPLRLRHIGRLAIAAAVPRCFSRLSEMVLPVMRVLHAFCVVFAHSSRSLK